MKEARTPDGAEHTPVAREVLSSEDAIAPTVSVVLPTFRRPEMVKRALRSVTDQTFDDWELLIVDDNGKGTLEQRRTEEVVRRLAVDDRIHYVVHERNKGACAARNTGIALSRGRFVAFLDDDDTWYPPKLSLQLECFERSEPAVALVYGGLRDVDEAGTYQVRRADGRAHVWRNLLMANSIGTTSLVMCRRDALLAVGGFDERLPSMQDYDLYLRLAQRYPFAFVAEPLLDKHRHDGETIGTNVESTLTAQKLFYEKHRLLYENDRVVHHRRLTVYGHQAIRAGRYGTARQLLFRAWLIRPTHLATLLAAAVVSRPLVAAVRVLRKGVRSRASARHQGRT